MLKVCVVRVWASLAAGAVIALAGGEALGQSRGDPFEETRTVTPLPRAIPRAPSSNVVTRTPGNLRRTTELRPVGGDIQPVAGDIRPVGGDVGVSGGGIRPVEVRSPLQNDPYFEGRLRPRTPRYGVIGHSVEPGWDDPPWGGRDVGEGAPARAARGATFGGYAESGSARLSIPATAGVGAASLGVSDIGGDGAGAAGESGAAAWAPRRRVRVPAGLAARPDEGERSEVVGEAPAVSDDAEWFDGPTTVHAGSLGGGRSDVRPELRMAVRMSLEGRLAGAQDTVRGAVYRDPEAFAGEPAVLTEAATRARVERAIGAWREAGARGAVTPSDASFMIAALSASVGEREAAAGAIRAARGQGESRPSGKMLHRVLNRGELPSGASSGGGAAQP